MILAATPITASISVEIATGGLRARFYLETNLLTAAHAGLALTA